MYTEDLSYGLFLSDRQLDFLSNYPQGFDRMKCFVTFLQMAVKEPTHYEKKEYSVDLTPGQFAISEVELAKLWKCNRKTASKMVDLFHEVGLVSSVPNCRTTVFTVHCIASWYAAGQVIRNSHYSRYLQVEPRIKANHKCQNTANGITDDGTVANGASANGSASAGISTNRTVTEDCMKDNSLLQQRLIWQISPLKQMGKPSNKGMSTPLSILSPLAVTIPMMTTTGKENNSIMVSSRPPRMKVPFPHLSHCQMQLITKTAQRTKRRFPLNRQVRPLQMLPPSPMTKRHPTMPDSPPGLWDNPEGSLYFRTL